MYGINVIYTMKSGKREEFLAGVAASGAQAAVRGLGQHGRGERL